MIEVPEVHQTGLMTIENWAQISNEGITSFQDIDFGLQMSPDGRVWICINGAAFIRFKPNRSGNGR